MERRLVWTRVSARRLIVAGAVTVDRVLVRDPDALARPEQMVCIDPAVREGVRYG